MTCLWPCSHYIAHFFFSSHKRRLYASGLARTEITTSAGVELQSTVSFEVPFANAWPSAPSATWHNRANHPCNVGECHVSKSSLFVQRKYNSQGFLKELLCSRSCWQNSAKNGTVNTQDRAPCPVCSLSRAFLFRFALLCQNVQKEFHTHWHNTRVRRISKEIMNDTSVSLAVRQLETCSSYGDVSVMYSNVQGTRTFFTHCWSYEDASIRHIRVTQDSERLVICSGLVQAGLQVGDGHFLTGPAAFSAQFQGHLV